MKLFLRCLFCALIVCLLCAPSAYADDQRYEQSLSFSVYDVRASVTCTDDALDVSVALIYTDTGNHIVDCYRLYVNGLYIADVPLTVEEGPRYCFEGVVPVTGEILSLRLVPMMDNGEEEWYTAIHLLESTETGRAVISTTDGALAALYQYPSEQSFSVIGRYYSGVKVSYTGSLNEAWVTVSIEGFDGCMQTAELKSMDDYTSVEMRLATGRVVNPPPTRFLNLRSGPYTDAEVLCRLETGDYVTVMGMYGEPAIYYHVATLEKVGFVKAEFLEVKEGGDGMAENAN